MCCPSGIAMGVMLTVDPGRFELTASAGALLIHRATDAAPDVAHQTDATRRLGFCPEHRDVKRAHLHCHVVRNHTAG